MTYSRGYLMEVKLDNTSVWKLTEENALGQPTKAVTGPLPRTYAYTAYGMPTERKAGTMQHFTYSFDVSKGNLSSRIDKLRNLTENFGYDNLNRLTTYGGKTTAYDVKGNITSMSGIGTMSYTQSNKPYALTGVALTGNQIPTRTQNVTYTSFQRPATITENGYVGTFTYNASGDRTKMQLTYNGTTQNNTYYIGGCYETNNSESRLYLAGDYYSSPIVYVKKNGVWGIYYICRDYLGSITHVTNSTGAVQQELSYDAWGRLRNPTTQAVYAPGSEPTLFLGRGYSGHEHLPLFGLINMNVRLYDPATGRFLSPDPFVQMIDFTQSFNRFSYCLNNPLVYVDKDGESILLIIGIAAVVGGIFNVATHWDAIKASGNIWKGVSYFGVGALAGGLGAVAGVGAAAVLGGLSGVAGGAVIGTAGGAVSGFALGGSNALLGGAGWSGFWRGASSGFASGAISGAVFGGIGGGVTSWIQGNNVWTGADIAQGRGAFSLKNTSLEPHKPA